MTWVLIPWLCPDLDDDTVVVAVLLPVVFSWLDYETKEVLKEGNEVCRMTLFENEHRRDRVPVSSGTNTFSKKRERELGTHIQATRDRQCITQFVDYVLYTLCSGMCLLCCLSLDDQREWKGGRELSAYNTSRRRTWTIDWLLLNDLVLDPWFLRSIVEEERRKESTSNDRDIDQKGKEAKKTDYWRKSETQVHAVKIEKSDKETQLLALYWGEEREEERGGGEKYYLSFCKTCSVFLLLFFLTVSLFDVSWSVCSVSCITKKDLHLVLSLFSELLSVLCVIRPHTTYTDKRQRETTRKKEAE